VACAPAHVLCHQAVRQQPGVVMPLHHTQRVFLQIFAVGALPMPTMAPSSKPSRQWLQCL
jgi:hypothetical protein